MAGSASGQDGPILPARDFPLCSRKKAKFFGVIFSPYNISFIDQLNWSRWLDIGLVLFCVSMDLDFVSVYKNAKKNLANIQPS